MKKITVPANHWEALTKSYSAQYVSEQNLKKGQVVKVKGVACQGALYTSFGIYYGTFGATRKPTIEAYRLLPMSMHRGETTLVYHDEQAIQAGTRKRGDHQGLVVRVQRDDLVCSERVDIEMSLPDTQPLSLAEARAHEAEYRPAGWRPLWRSEDPFNESTWFSLEGHPVVRYGAAAGSHTLVQLLWTDGQRIHEMTLANDLELATAIDSPSAFATQSRKTQAAEEQLALFA